MCHRDHASQQRSSSPSSLFCTRIASGSSSPRAASGSLGQDLFPVRDGVPTKAGAVGGEDTPRLTKVNGDLSLPSIAENHNPKRPPAETPRSEPLEIGPTANRHRHVTSAEMAVSTSEATLAEASPPTLNGRVSYSEHDEQMKLMQQQLVQALAEVQEVCLWQTKVDNVIDSRFRRRTGN